MFNLMEDTATAEISRVKSGSASGIHAAFCRTGKVTKELFRSVLEEELAKIQSWVGQEWYQKGQYGEAAELFDRITTSDQFVEFLTLPGYERLD
jgi:malate synthase